MRNALPVIGDKRLTSIGAIFWKASMTIGVLRNVIAWKVYISTC